MDDIINCTKSAATVIFHAELAASTWFDKYDFPMPKCLVVPGKGLRADIFMTLAYDPPTDARFSTDYCRCNVTASLGTVAFDPKTGKSKFTAQMNQSLINVTAGCDTALVKEGFYWSPLKFYHHSFVRGPVGARWRLHIDSLDRSRLRA